MSKTESNPNPEPVSDEERSLHYPPRISSLFMVGGPIVAAAGGGGCRRPCRPDELVVLFALFALPPLMMVACAPVMMTAMRGSLGSGFSGARWCAPWLRSDLDRTTSAD